MTSQTRIEQAFRRLMTVVITMETKLVNFPAFIRGNIFILTGKQIATNESRGIIIKSEYLFYYFLPLFKQDAYSSESFPFSKENRKGVSKHAKEIKFQVCRGGEGGERNTCSQFNFLRYYNVTLVVYSPNSTSLTFIIYIFREWKSASSRSRYVTRGDRNLLNRWSPLAQGRETRFRYPCYRHNPPSQFIRCSILDILSLSNFLRLSRIFVISFDDDVTMIRTIMI